VDNVLLFEFDLNTYIQPHIPISGQTSSFDNDCFKSFICNVYNWL